MTEMTPDTFEGLIIHTPKSYLRALACLKVLQEVRVLLTDKYLQLFDINNNQVVLLRYYKLKPLQLRH